MSITNIYTGVWTNHSRGRVYGTTLTLTDAQATALVSFLAVLITLTSTRSFKILRYVWYHLRTHEIARDGLARQQDVLLRNAETDMGTLPLVPWIAWKWRGHTRNPLRRSIMLFVLMLLHTMGFIVAGIATSFVAAGNDQPVIAKGTDCGYWMVDTKDMRDAGPLAEYQKSRLKVGTATRAYARMCYDQDGGEQDRSECRVFPKVRLTRSDVHNASCPFKDEICLEGDTAAYTLDTGLQSSEELGINSPHTLHWQHRMTCAPLKTEGYTEYRIGTGNYGENVTHYMYGGVGLLGNSSYWISDWERLTAEGYIFSVVTSAPWVGNGSFQLFPIPALQRNDADVTLLFFAAYGVDYWERTSPSPSPFPSPCPMTDISQRSTTPSSPRTMKSSPSSCPAILRSTSSKPTTQSQSSAAPNKADSATPAQTSAPHSSPATTPNPTSTTPSPHPRASRTSPSSSMSR
jgi:hypothetical protein